MYTASFFLSCVTASLTTAAPLTSSYFSLLVAARSMEAFEDCKWRQIPAFGDWNLWDDMPVTQYFEPGTFFFTAHAGEDEVDLFKVPQFASKPYTYSKCVVRVKGGADLAAPARKGGRKQQQQGKEQRKKRMPKARAAAVDEDLYKISPKAVCKVQKKKLLRNLLGGCLGLNCIA